MTKTKTLNEINPILKTGLNSTLIFVDRESVRQEAIKWLKHFNSNNGDFIKDKDWQNFTDSGYDEYTGHAYGNIIDWIKHFFNLTEEDLK